MIIVLPFISFLVSGFFVIIPVLFVLGIPFGSGQYLAEFPALFVEIRSTSFVLNGSDTKFLYAVPKFFP